MCLSETHLKNNNNIDIHGFTWYGHNRVVKHVNAVRGSGGVGILIKDQLMNDFEITCIDKSVDGIISLNLKNKQTDFHIFIINGYLPPENSPYSCNSTDFFSHIMTQLYINYDADFVLVCGDFNCRTGRLQDVIMDIDDVTSRDILDEQKNNFGEILIDFLHDAKLFMLNGRVSKENNNYTSISTRGKAVVDYMLTFHDCLDKCKFFNVITMNEIIEKVNVQSLISERCKPPDHSILTVTVDCLHNLFNNRGNNSDVSCDNSTPANVNKINHNRYNFKQVPDAFMSSNNWKTNLNKVLDRLISLQNNQVEIDKTYSDFCNILTLEMNTYLKYTGASKRSRKLFKNKKPYWNDNLTKLWKEMNKLERQFIKCKGPRNAKETKRRLFYEARNIFDKELRNTERKYNQQVVCDIDEVCTSNPSEFWNYLKSLGPRKKNHIPMKVYEGDSMITDIEQVLERWKLDFESLYNNQSGEEEFDQEFYTDLMDIKMRREQEMDSDNYEMNEYINQPLSYDEIENVTKNLKLKKATGFDSIPNEVLKHPDVIYLLYKLLDKCFEYCKVPSIWLKSIITPIPKSADKDPFVPINYRGISLLSCISKIFSSIINNRIVNYLEFLELYADEQNGFRKNRACIDHIYTLTSVIRNRQANKKSTYCCFIDMKKAFDWVNRDLLLYKLLSYNIDGKIYKCIKAMYSNPISSIKLNDYLTDWFHTDSGVRQGDSLSPTLFGIFVNDLVQDINQLNIGIQAGDINLSILLYADDIVLMAENESDLQTMLDCVYQWCKQWRLVVNEDKTKIMHFRNDRSHRTEFVFKYGAKELEVVNYYKYLGVILDEFLKFEEAACTLARAGGRALGSIISKFRTFQNIGYNTFSKMFDTSVCPILKFCSGVWGL